MEHIPIGSLLLLVSLDIAIVLALSVAIGGSMARGSGTDAWKGMAVGLVAPVVGPLVWGLAALARDHSRALPRRIASRPVALVLVASIGALAALLFIIGMFLPWAHVSGDVQAYRFATDQSAIDTGVGLVASVVTAAVALLSVAVAMMFSAWRRLAFLMTAVGSIWLLVTVDGLIVFSALGDVGEAVNGLSAGRATAEAQAAPGLWFALVASVLMLTAAVALGWLPRDSAFEPRMAVSTVLPTSVLSSPSHPAASVSTSWGAGEWGAVPPAPPAAESPTWGGGADWGSPASPAQTPERGTDW